MAIELPTGAGKTLIALLIAETRRRQGNTVAILSANKTLARQMLSEAQSLGIPAVLMEGTASAISARDKRAYQRATAVAIMNYWVYYNQNPVIDPASLLIMDDAHLAEHCLHSLYSVEIDRYSRRDLFKALIAELRQRFPDYAVLTDALADDPPPTGATDLLSFIDQADFAGRLREIVDASPYLKTDTDLAFRWSRGRGRLQEANIYIGINSIWIRPYVYPLRANPHYGRAAQRLYMSATVGDPADLARRLGVKPIKKIPVPPEFGEKTSGRRLILMNRVDEGDIPRRLQSAILTALRIHPKSVWLCSSPAEATKLEARVSKWLPANGLGRHPTWVLTPLGDEIEQFKGSPNGHLFVAGRFDGMDFSADQCRLVVVATLPRAINAQEEFISAYLRDSGFMRSRLNHRIVQALGRCNCSPGDFGIYVLADRRFATHFGRESNRAGMPRNIVAEIDMAQDLAEGDEAAVVQKVESFLKQDFGDYDAELASYLAEVPPAPASAPLADTSSDEVVGWTALFASQNYSQAAKHFERCWQAALKANTIEIGALHGWHWAKALYLQGLLGEPGVREKALQVLESAIRRGGRSSWFNRMRASLNRARKAPEQEVESARDDYAAVVLRRFDDLLEQLGTTGDGFQRWCDQRTTELTAASHRTYQVGLERLGDALGYHTSRPSGQSAADCLWRGVFGNAKETVTFEAKVEQAPSQQVTASDVGQAHNQVARAQAEYGKYGYTVRGVIVTHLSSLTPDAEAAAGDIRVVTRDAVLELWQRVQLLLSRYRDGWSLDDLGARARAGGAIRPGLPPTGWLTRAIDTDERFVGVDHLLKEWPSVEAQV